MHIILLNFLICSDSFKKNFHRRATFKPSNDKIRQRTFVANWLDVEFNLRHEISCRTDFENTLNLKDLMPVTGDVSENLERFQVHLKNKQRAEKGTILLLPRKIELGLTFPKIYFIGLHCFLFTHAYVIKFNFLNRTSCYTNGRSQAGFYYLKNQKLRTIFHDIYFKVLTIFLHRPTTNDLNYPLWRF